jgi:hypothetical protein
MLSHPCPSFLLCCIVLDNRNPVPLSSLNAANVSATVVGRANSLLKPMHYIIVFSFFDVVALAIQSVGGAGAAKAQENGTSTVTPTHLMVQPTLH